MTMTLVMIEVRTRRVFCCCQFWTMPNKHQCGDNDDDSPVYWGPGWLCIYIFICFCIGVFVYSCICVFVHLCFVCVFVYLWWWKSIEVNLCHGGLWWSPIWGQISEALYSPASLLHWLWYIFLSIAIGTFCRYLIHIYTYVLILEFS